MVDENSKALAKRQPTMTLQEAGTAYPEAKYNLLLPKIHIGELPDGTRLAIREVTIADSPVDVYPVDGGKVALTKVALNKIAAAAGITWVSVDRTDDRSHPYYCEFTARAKVTDFDGTIRESVGTKTVDLRDDAGGGIAGKDLASIKSEKQLNGARKFITEMCASKAMNRAIADVLAIPRSYNPPDLARPFVVPKLVLDSSDPFSKKAIVAGMVGATQALFGPAPIPEEKIVDATFEEPADAGPQPPQVGTEEAAGSDSLPGPVASEGLPEMDGPSEDPDVKPDKATVMARLNVAWQRARTAGMDVESWKSFVANNTGKSHYEDMTNDDLRQIDGAVEAFIGALS